MSALFSDSADDIGLGDTLDPGSTSFTVMAWVKVSSQASWSSRYIIGKDAGGGTPRGWALTAENTGANTVCKIQLYVPLDTSGSPSCFLGVASSTISLTVGTWYHITMIMDFSSGTVTSFQDGVQKDSNTNASVTSSDAGTNNLRIGNTDRGSQFWEGNLAEVKYFGRVLTAAEIVAEMYCRGVWDTRNLQLYLPLDNHAIPSIYYDLSGNGRNGTTAGTLVVGDHPPVGGQPGIPMVVATTGTSYTQNVFETVTITDSITRGLTRTLSEVVTVVDSVIKIPARVFSEIITVTDSLIRELTRVLTETVTITDSIVRSVTRTLSEVITVTDSLTRSITKVISEVITIIDSLGDKVLDKLYKLFSPRDMRVGDKPTGTVRDNNKPTGYRSQSPDKPVGT